MKIIYFEIVTEVFQTFWARWNGQSGFEVTSEDLICKQWTRECEPPKPVCALQATQKKMFWKYPSILNFTNLEFLVALIPEGMSGLPLFPCRETKMSDSYKSMLVKGVLLNMQDDARLYIYLNIYLYILYIYMCVYVYNEVIIYVYVLFLCVWTCMPVMRM